MPVSMVQPGARGAVVLIALIASVAHAADPWKGPCNGACVEKAQRLLAEADRSQPADAMRAAQTLANLECTQDPGEKAACALAGRLGTWLAEHDAAPKDPPRASRILLARRCAFALTDPQPEPDWSTLVVQACDSAFDACRPGLMLLTGHATPATRTSVISSACAETACAKAPAPKACAEKDDRAKLFGLLPAVLERDLNASAATALIEALRKPAHPFFTTGR